MGGYRAVLPGSAQPWHPVVARRGAHASIRASKESEQWQASIGQHCWLAVRSVNGARVLGPCWVRVVAVEARPKHAQGVHRGRPACRYPCGRAPDVDKVARNVLDGLSLYTVLGMRRKGGGVIEDDARVARLEVESWYGAEGEGSHVVIEWGALAPLGN